ncbi:MAG: DUF4062 domain-containing protein [Candidatus Cyclobacteriaceae bacterium M2_1C_046]
MDILITYSINDNLVDGKEQGWVTNFHKFLQMLLQQIIGEKIDILLKNEEDNITAANLNDVGIIIPVLSKSFISSEKNIGLLEGFLKLPQKDKISRVFKVLKQPVPREEQPEKLRNLLPYELYSINPETDETTEFIEFFSKEAEHDFWMKMVDLAYDIYESLLVIKTGEQKTNQALFSRRTVYLAEIGNDLIVQRNIIKRELQRYGHRVLPDHALPTDLNELKKNIKKEIDEADLSIHLIGSSYGEVPAGSERSILDIQNQVALEKSKENKKFQRLVWIPTNFPRASERQKTFIENLKRDTVFSESSGIFQTPLEDFKNILREELLIFGSKKKLNLLTEEELLNEKPTVYLLHDKVDKKEAQHLISHIKKAGYQVLIPGFEGELLDLRQIHINNLQRFDAAIIYQNKVNDQWVHMKLLDLLKAPGFGRSKPIKGRAVFTEKEPKYLQSYSPDNVVLVNGEKENILNSLDEFLKNLK